MKHAVTPPGLATQPAPPQDRPGQPVPRNIAALLVIVRTLLAFGRRLSATLERRAAKRSFSLIAQFFGTARLAVIRARIARGILRAEALEQLLLALAAGDDLLPCEPVWRPEREPRPPALRQATGRAANRPGPSPKPEESLELPTPEQMQADVRRGAIGQAIADICRDLGVAPGLCDSGFWTRLHQSIRLYGGDFSQYEGEMLMRQIDFVAELERERIFAFDWPDPALEGTGAILGFLIGTAPVSPVLALAAARMPAAAATGPP